MNPQDLPKGPGSGEMADLAGRKPMNEAGVYRHEAAGKEIIVLPDSKSTAQQDALVRMGFVRVADAPTMVELRDMQAAQVAKDIEDEKDGILPALPVAPSQSVIYNGSVTDTGGAASAQSQIDAANARAAEAEAALATALAQAQQGTPSGVDAEAANEQQVEAEDAANTAVEEGEPSTPVEEPVETKN
jgi:hypothetical protein